MADVIAAAERVRATERRASMREQAEHSLRMQKWNVLVQEDLQWLEGQNGRLLRKGRNSFIQVRPIVSVSATRLRISTEKVYETMAISFCDIVLLEIKYEGERTYTKISLPDRDSIKVTEQEIEEYIDSRIR